MSQDGNGTFFLIVYCVLEDSLLKLVDDNGRMKIINKNSLNMLFRYSHRLITESPFPKIGITIILPSTSYLAF